ncbi:hypothetical protein [Piscirickettsia salmonis]|uniref:hypothetical protein n=1 Tax=Piscirickettsia salmonis TaxID=1238 RepID=UPI0012BB0A20|nr:hypothetical protein [Piscirickettsia salmonis]
MLSTPWLAAFAYNSLLPIFQENCPNYKLPKIEQDKIITEEEINSAVNNYIHIPNISYMSDTLTQKQRDCEAVYS